MAGRAVECKSRVPYSAMMSRGAGKKPGTTAYYADINTSMAAQAGQRSARRLRRRLPASSLFSVDRCHGVETTDGWIAGLHAYEAAHRGDRLKAEWDLAASNVLQLSVANAMTVWCLTPARSFGAAHKYGWQRVMDSIPNNAFDRCGPLRQYTMGTRAASFGVKALELSALGAATGGVFHGLNKALVGLHRRNDADFEPAVPVPDLKTSVLGMGAYLGLSCNLRYQLIGGADRWMTERLTTLASAITATGLGRLANSQLGDQTRLFALGLPVHATAVRSAAPKKSKKKTVTKKVKKKKSKKNAAARETAMA